LKVGLASSSFWRRRVIFAGKEIRFTENIGITIISVEDPIIFQRKVSEKFFRCRIFMNWSTLALLVETLALLA
jgi:hypothetical protein